MLETQFSAPPAHSAPLVSSKLFPVKLFPVKLFPIPTVSLIEKLN